MVGYQKNDSMTTTEKLVSGCLSGFITRFITQPLDVVKLRSQLQKKAIPNPHRKWFKITRRIFKEEGLAAFFQGHNLGQVHSILSVSSQFYVYELTTGLAANTPLMENHRHCVTFLCGLLSGCCSATLVNPLEVVRTRQILVKQQYKGILNGGRIVYKSGGILAFYEGWTASLLQIGPSAAISFSVFGIMQPLLLSHFHDCEDGRCKLAAGNEHQASSVLLASSAAGAAAGLISKTLTYPFDLAKKRMQIKSHIADDKFITPNLSKDLARCSGLVECLTETFKTEGLKGLFRGFKVTIYKAQLTSVVAFTSYELICYAFRELN